MNPPLRGPNRPLIHVAFRFDPGLATRWALSLRKLPMSRYPFSQRALQERSLRHPLDFRAKAHRLVSFADPSAGITNRAVQRPAESSGLRLEDHFDRAAAAPRGNLECFGCGVERHPVGDQRSCDLGLPSQDRRGRIDVSHQAMLRIHR